MKNASADMLQGNTCAHPQPQPHLNHTLSLNLNHSLNHNLTLSLNLNHNLSLALGL